MNEVAARPRSPIVTRKVRQRTGATHYVVAQGVSRLKVWTEIRSDELHSQHTYHHGQLEDYEYSVEKAPEAMTHLPKVAAMA